jgi:hypothetical protein
MVLVCKDLVQVQAGQALKQMVQVQILRGEQFHLVLIQFTE